MTLKTLWFVILSLGLVFSAQAYDPKKSYKVRNHPNYWGDRQIEKARRAQFH